MSTEGDIISSTNTETVITSYYPDNYPNGQYTNLSFQYSNYIYICAIGWSSSSGAVAAAPLNIFIDLNHPDTFQDNFDVDGSNWGTRCYISKISNTSVRLKVGVMGSSSYPEYHGGVIIYQCFT